MKCLVLSLFLCLSLYAHTQIHLAIKAGPQTATARYSRMGQKISTKQITGFNAGVLGKVYFDDRVAFVTGLQYNARGFTVNTLPGDTQRTYHLNYLDIPILLQIDFSKQKNKGLYCRVGPVLGIGLGGKEIYTGSSGNEIRRKAVMSVTGNYFGLFDASLNAMLGIHITPHLFAEAAYSYGIGNINNDPDGPNIKSRVLSAGLGWWFK